MWCFTHREWNESRKEANNIGIHHCCIAEIYPPFPRRNYNVCLWLIKTLCFIHQNRAYIWFAVIDFGHYGIARFNGSLGSVWYSGHSHFQYRFTCQIMVRMVFLNYQRHAWKTALSLPRVAGIQFWQRDNIFVFVSSDFLSSGGGRLCSPD